MAAISTIIGGIGVAASVAGTAISFKGQSQAQRGAERAEAIRESQMRMEANRERRNQIRQGMIARAQVLAAGVNQGAQQGSGVAGGMGSAVSQAAEGVANVNAGEGLGRQMFQTNRDIARGNSLASLGSGVSSLGGILMNNAGTFGRVGSFMSRGALPA